MILEVAVLHIKQGLDKDFEASFRQASSIISRRKGYISHELQKCMEQDHKYVLLVRWETLEDHTQGFRGSPEYLEWKQLLHHYYDPFPVVEHYENVSLELAEEPETTIYMVRHAESPYIAGEEKTRGLSAEGAADAARVAELLRDAQIDGIVSSSYTRAVQTVQPLAAQKGLPILEFDELKERPIIGIDSSSSWDEMLIAIRKSFEDLDFALEGGESTRQAQQRAIPVLEKLLQEHRGQSIAIGTHGNIMTIIMNYYDSSYGYDFWSTTSKPDIYKMTFHGNRLHRVDRVWST